MTYCTKDGAESFILRAARDDDFCSVIDCLKEIYKGKYANKKVFEKDYLKNNKDISFFVAVDKDGKVVSTLGLAQPNLLSGTFELIMHTVREEYRHKGISIALVNYAMDAFQNQNCFSFCSRPVSATPASQRILERCGLSPTGFLFNIYDSKQAPTQDTVSQKQSFAVYAKKNKKKDAAKLFVCEGLSHFTKKIYASLGVDFEIITSAPEKQDETVLKDFYDEPHATLYIALEKCGGDLPDIIRNLQAAYGSHPLQSSIVYLNINHFGAIDGFSALCKLGYKFSGFSPLCKDGEYIIMFHPQNSKLNVSAIKTTPLLAEILDEINVFDRGAK